jgi:hypothetical protein
MRTKIATALLFALLAAATVLYMGHDRSNTPDVWITMGLFGLLFGALGYRVGHRWAGHGKAGHQ